MKNRSDLVGNDFVKKTVYNELVKRLMTIILGNLLRKQIIMLRSKILKAKYPTLVM